MTELVPTSKRCPHCGEVKSLVEFYFVKRTGRPHSWCKRCMIDKSRRVQAKLRQTEEGAELLRRQRRESYARHGKAPSHLAVERATKELIERHRAEYDALYRIALYEERGKARAGNQRDGAEEEAAK